MSRGRILVIRGGAIGDFILTLPVLSALQGQFPETEIQLLAYPNVAALALEGGLAEAVKSIEARPLAGFFARNGALDEGLQEYFASFAIIISYLYDPDGIFQENVARCSKAQFIAGPHRPNEAETIHATDVFLKPLERLAIFGADPEPALKLTPGGVGTELELWVTSGQTLAVHPGSGSEQKNWPEAKWKELLERLVRETGLRLLLVGGEAEKEKLQRVVAVAPRERAMLADSLPLTRLALLLQQCGFFLSHDSGISHLAAAVRTPGLVLWGPTNEKIWRPRSENVQVLKADGGLVNLGVAEVFAAVCRGRNR